VGERGFGRLVGDPFYLYPLNINEFYREKYLPHHLRSVLINNITELKKDVLSSTSG
jgi:hypothetical protein